MDDEVMVGEVLALAQAVHNCGGKVIAQVRRLLDQPAAPHTVRVPGVLVDRIVVGKPHEHEQSFGQPFTPGYFQARNPSRLSLSTSDGSSRRVCVMNSLSGQL